MTALDPRLTPARGDLAAATLRGKVTAERFVEGESFIIATEFVDLKRAPRPDAPLDTQLLFGEAVTVYDEDEEGWAWVQAARDSYVGYVAVAALVRGTGSPTHRVTVKRTFVYPGPDLKLPVVGAIPLDGEVIVVGTSGVYSRIGGGYVFTAHLAPNDVVVLDYVDVAEALMGAPYLWGGKTSLGIDCSGLVQVSTSAGGLALPRDTDLQAAIGEDLPADEALAHLRRGDLVFWRGHVGIMRDSETLLHANAHHMLVASEPLQEARDRIRAGASSEIMAVRRLNFP